MADIFNPITGKRTSVAVGDDNKPTDPGVDRKYGKQLYKDNRNTIVMVSGFILVVLIFTVVAAHYEVGRALTDNGPKRPLTLEELKRSESPFMDFMCRGRKCKTD